MASAATAAKTTVRRADIHSSLFGVIGAELSRTACVLRRHFPLFFPGANGPGKLNLRCGTLAFRHRCFLEGTRTEEPKMRALAAAILATALLSACGTTTGDRV